MTSEQESLFTFLNHSLAIVTLIGFIIVAVWAIDELLLCLGLYKGHRLLYRTIARHALPLGFIATLGATILSLVYSDYLGVLPCGLCWFQRVSIYSQMFILGLAWWKRDTKVWAYSTVLSVFGLIVALYHQYLQLGYSELLPCPAIASTVDCANPTFMEYGFVTFPFMSVVLFIFLLLLSQMVKRYTAK